MRILVDNALSPGVAVALADQGHDAIHVGEVGLRHSTDTEIFEFAAQERRVVVSADTDFGTILALRAERAPSVVLWRRQSPRRPKEQAVILGEVVNSLAEELKAGAIVVIDAGRIRVRSLPIGGDPQA